MRFKLAKDAPGLKWATLAVAGIVGMLTGAAVGDMPLANAVAIAVLTGLAAGGVLYVILKLITRKPS